jgi:molybdopterin-guanine dinucleotide biosynthesis protein A
MGRPKALLPLPDGLTIIEKVLQAATSVSPAPDDVVILGQAHALPGSLQHRRILPDEQDNAGPLAGLASLLRFAGERWALLLACDMPGLEPACLTPLLAHAGPHVDAVVFHQGDGHTCHPCCGLYHPRVLPAVLQELRHGKGSIHHVLHAIRLLPLEAGPDIMRQLANINSPADYQRFCMEESKHTMKEAAPASNEIKVRLFGPLARQLGKSEIRVSPDEPGPTSRRVLTILAEIEPGLLPVMKSLRLAVNHGFAEEGQIVKATDEVALIGMVSGG